jgi:hypothetical protein
MHARTRKFIRLLLLLLLAAGVFPFFYPWGNPMLSWQELELPELPPLDLEMELPTLGQTESAKAPPVTVYRWRNADGSWNFSSTPPQGEVAYQSMQLDPNANLIQGLPAEGEETTAAKAETTERSGEKESWEGFSYSTEDVRQLMGQAREARDALEQHNERQAEMIEQAQ